MASAERGPAEPDRFGSRDRVLRAAAACFAKDGYAQTRMVAIARSAGVSRAGLYKHFASKEDLLLALNQKVITDWRAWTEESIAQAPSAREAIERWLREGLTDRERITAVQVVTAEDAQQALLTDHGATRQALHDTQGILEQVLANGVETGELRDDLDVRATAKSLQAILQGLLRNQLAERPIATLEGTADIDALVELVLGGVVARRRRRRARSAR